LHSLNVDQVFQNIQQNERVEALLQSFKKKPEGRNIVTQEKSVEYPKSFVVKDQSAKSIKSLKHKPV